MQLSEMLDKRNQLVADATSLNNGAMNEGRNFSKPEKVKYDATMLEVRDLNEQITRAQELQAIETALAASQGTRAAHLEGSGNDPAQPGGGGDVPGEGEVRLLAPSERLYDLVPHAHREKENLNKLLRGWIYGKWDADSDREKRALSGSADVLGGYTVSEGLSAEIVDLSRNLTACIAAGAKTVNLPESIRYVARVSGDATGYWRHENTQITESDMTFDRVAFIARVLAILVRMSQELSDDCVDGGAAIKRAIATALAVSFDYACLMGVGAAAEPLGLYNTVGINEVAAGGPLTFDHLIEACSKIWEANGTPGAIILSPRDAGLLAKMKDGEGHYLAWPEPINGLKRIITNQCPKTLGVGTNESVCFVGDFSKLVIGIRSPLRLEIGREAGDAFAKLQIMLRAFVRGDVCVMRETHFTKITGITA